MNKTTQIRAQLFWIKLNAFYHTGHSSLKQCHATCYVHAMYNVNHFAEMSPYRHVFPLNLGLVDSWFSHSSLCLAVSPYLHFPANVWKLVFKIGNQCASKPNRLLHKCKSQEYLDGATRKYHYYQL